jgi:hypothetical protein
MYELRESVGKGGSGVLGSVRIGVWGVEKSRQGV